MLLLFFLSNSKISDARVEIREAHAEQTANTRGSTLFFTVTGVIMMMTSRDERGGLFHINDGLEAATVVGAASARNPSQKKTCDGDTLRDMRC